MTRDEVIARLKNHESELRARGVEHLALFGSVARGDDDSASDVDVLVDIADIRRFSLIDQASLRLLLCDILDRETDLVLAQNMRSRMRERVLHDKVEVF